MARILTCGFEVGDARLEPGAGAPPGGAVTHQTGTPTIDTTTFRSGARALKINLTSGGQQVRFGGLGGLEVPQYHRLYVRFEAFPSSGTIILVARPTGAGIRVNTSGGLEAMFNNGGTLATSANLSLNTWYCIEFLQTIRAASNDDLEFRIDGVSWYTSLGVARGTTASTNLDIGYASTGAGCIFYVDDVAANDDTTGSGQTSYPGAGKVVLLKPTSDSAVGTGWMGPQTTGSDTTDLYQAVDNTPPLGVAHSDVDANNNLYVFNATSTNSANFDVNATTYTAAGIDSDDEVKVAFVFAVLGSSSATDTAGALRIVSNPAEGAETSFNNFDAANVVAAATPTGWAAKKAGVNYAISPTLGTSPVLRVGKRTNTTRVAMVSFIGEYVDYNPRTTETPAPGGATAAGTGPTTTFAEAMDPGGALAGGVEPTEDIASEAVEETPVPGGGTAAGVGPTTQVGVTQGGAIGAGTGPTTTFAEAMTPGGATAAGQGPGAATGSSSGGATGGAPSGGGGAGIEAPVLLDGALSNLVGTHIATLTTGATVPVGAKLILALAWVRDNDPGTISITDGGGLTWTEDVYIPDTGHDNDMVQQVYSAPAPAGLASGTDIDLELSSAEGSAWGFIATVMYAEGVGDYETSTWYTVYGFPGDREFWVFPLDTTNPDCLLIGSHFLDGNTGANDVDAPATKLHEEVDSGNQWTHLTMYQIVSSPQTDFVFAGETSNNVPFGQSFLALAYEGLPVGGGGVTAAVAVGQGGATAGGVAPTEDINEPVDETPTPGGGTAGGVGPTATTAVAVGGATAAGNGPTTTIVATATAGGALAGGTGPTTNIVATTTAGGATGGGTGPASTTTATAVAGGAVGGGVGGGASSACGQGGATCAGTGASARVTFTAGGALAGGVAPSTSEAMQETPVPGGATAAGAGPTARVTFTAGGATAAGNAPSENILITDTPTPGGAVATGTGPSARTSVTPGGAAGGGQTATARAVVLSGGGVASGTEPDSEVAATATPGGAIAGANSPLVRVAVPGGLAVASGTTPTAFVIATAPIGGALAGGTAPFEDIESDTPVLPPIPSVGIPTYQGPSVGFNTPRMRSIR